MSNEDKLADKLRAHRKPKPKKATPRKQLSREQISQLLTEIAFKAPHETTADICEKFGVSEKTAQRWKKRLADDPELSAKVAANKTEFTEGLKETRARFLKNSINHLEKLVLQGTVENMRDIVGAIKIVGELDGMSQALGLEDNHDEQPGRDRQGSPAAEAEGTGPEGAAGQGP